MTNDHKIKDINLSESGRRRVDWARSRMPILGAIKKRLSVEQPFSNHLIGICLHVEAKTGVWIETLMSGGAKVAITGSPGTTQDDTAAYLVKELGVKVFAWRSETVDEHMQNARRVLDKKPSIIADNGGDLHSILDEEAGYDVLRESLLGATEETTTGANRLRETLPPFGFPTIVINDTMVKRIVENRYGVGSSVVDGIMRATNIMVSGKTALVIGYGYCGQGIAQRLRGLGAHVTIVDTAPLAQLEAHLEGFRTGVLEDLLPGADIVLTVTGRDAVLKEEHLPLMKNGVVLANAGAFSSEIEIECLKEMALESDTLRPNVERFLLDGGKEIFLLAKGNLINLAAGDGNPIEAMDVGLALQTLSLECLALHADTLCKGPQTVPYEIEQACAEAALQEWV